MQITVDCKLKYTVVVLSVRNNVSFSSDGQGEKRLTSTVWSPLLESFLTQTLADSTGPSSGRWLGCTRKLTKVCRNTCVLLPPCADGCVASHPKKEVRSLPAYSHMNTHTHTHMHADKLSVFICTHLKSGHSEDRILTLSSLLPCFTPWLQQEIILVR